MMIFIIAMCKKKKKETGRRFGLNLKLAISQAYLSISQTLMLHSKEVTGKGCSYVFPYMEVNNLKIQLLL